MRLQSRLFLVLFAGGWISAPGARGKHDRPCVALLPWSLLKATGRTEQGCVWPTAAHLPRGPLSPSPVLNPKPYSQWTDFSHFLLLCQNCPSAFAFLCTFLKISSLGKEKARERGQEWGGRSGGERQCPADSVLSTEPHAGLNPTTPTSRRELNPRRRRPLCKF